VPTCKDLLRLFFVVYLVEGRPYYNPEKPSGCFFWSVQGGSLIQHLTTVRVYNIYLFIYLFILRCPSSIMRIFLLDFNQRNKLFISLIFCILTWDFVHVLLLGLTFESCFNTPKMWPYIYSYFATNRGIQLGVTQTLLPLYQKPQYNHMWTLLRWKQFYVIIPLLNE
jgi:hypothetical protein